MSFIKAATTAVSVGKKVLQAGEKYAVTNVKGTTFMRAARGSKAASPAIEAAPAAQSAAVAGIAKAKAVKPNGSKIAAAARDIGGIHPYSSTAKFGNKLSAVEKAHAKIDSMNAAELRALHGKVFAGGVKAPRSKAGVAAALKQHVTAKSTPPATKPYSSSSASPSHDNGVSDALLWTGVGLGLLGLSSS